MNCRKKPKKSLCNRCTKVSQYEGLFVTYLELVCYSFFKKKKSIS